MDYTQPALTQPGRRLDQVEADVTCLMCGRVVGTLYGWLWREANERTAPSLTHLTSFRSATSGARTVPLTTPELLRCTTCLGPGLVDEVSVTRVGESLPTEQLCPIHGSTPRASGRPPNGCRCYSARAAA
jgi:hypothetical protein